MADHIWEDVSYSGSPTYQCEACYQLRDAWDCSALCPGRNAFEKKRIEQEKDRELKEYSRLLADRERFEYLHSKYGDSK